MVQVGSVEFPLNSAKIQADSSNLVAVQESSLNLIGIQESSSILEVIQENSSILVGIQGILRYLWNVIDNNRSPCNFKEHTL